MPGDILTDMQRAGRVGDPYWNTTWRDPDFITAWNKGTWRYTKSFATPAPALAPASADSRADSSTAGSYLLVLDGVRMGAMVSLNGQFLGNASNQFLRYTFPLPVTALAPVAGGADADGDAGAALNELTITFGAELMIDCGGQVKHEPQLPHQ